MKKLFTIIALLGIITITQAQQEQKKLISGNSFNVMLPQGTFADTYNHGFGIYANIDYNFNKFLAARFDLGWNDVSGPESSYMDADSSFHTHHPNMSVWEFTGGLRLKVAVVYAEVRGGYFTGLNEWGFVPAAGLRFGKFDIQGSYSIVGDNQWFSGRIAYYWGN